VSNRGSIERGVRGENGRTRRETTVIQLKRKGGVKWRDGEGWASKREDGFDDGSLGTARRRLRQEKEKRSRRERRGEKRGLRCSNRLGAGKFLLTREEGTGQVLLLGKWDKLTSRPCRRQDPRGKDDVGRGANECTDTRDIERADY
jgi:hypothetical protein